MEKYELRLLAANGHAIGIYSFDCADDERAKAKIFAVGDVPYARYEVWRGMEKIAEGARFVCANISSMPFRSQTAA